MYKYTCISPAQYLIILINVDSLEEFNQPLLQVSDASWFYELFEFLHN